MAHNYISTEELQASTTMDFEDGFVIALLRETTGATLNEVLTAAMKHTRGWYNETYLVTVKFTLFSTGRIPKGMRQYCIDVLCGKHVFVAGGKAFLFA